MEYWDESKDAELNRVYEFILEYRRRHGGNSPSYRTIQTGLGISSVSTVFYRVDKLVRQGKLRRIDGKICVVKQAKNGHE